jgi:riboflavin synthase
VFTGIVETSVAVLSVRDQQGIRSIQLENRWGVLRHGESIAVNGVCLTVVGFDDRSVVFQVVRETLDRTTLGDLTAGDEVHVERSLRLGDRFDGHFVQGHVDGLAEVVKINADPMDWRLAGRLSMDLARYLAPKGSICLDGVSLTLSRVAPPYFEVALIPATLEITRLGRRAVGSRLNVECDIITKTIVQTLERRAAGEQASTERFWE